MASEERLAITWFLVAMAGAEALEHNAIVSGNLLDIGKKLKRMLSEDEWDELIYQLDWFEHPITEFTAGLAILGSLTNIEEICRMDVSTARALYREAFEALERAETATARSKLLHLKNEILSLGQSWERKLTGR